MNITKTDIDELNAQVTIELTPEDYQDKVTKILSDYRKKMNMPGFRPGMVPMGMVKKMYGKAVLAEELNKLFSNQLIQFLTEQKIEVLGQPLPSTDESNKIDLDEKDFKYTYDLGLAPDFSVGLSSKDKVDYYDIQIDQNLIDKYSSDVAKRYGKVKEVDQAAENDMIHACFKEVDGDGSIVEGGMHNHSTIALEYVEDKSTKDKLVGMKVEESLVLDPVKVSRGPADLAALLNISRSKAEKLKTNFLMEVEKVYQMTPHELNQELFDKIYGPDQVKTVEEFHEKVREELEKNLEVDADRKFHKDLADKLMAKLKVRIPEEFLKRWILETNEEVTPEQLDEEWDKYAEGMTWQIIESRIVKENELSVTREEAVAHTKELIGQQMSVYGQAGLPDDQLEEMANNFLSKEEEAQRIYDQVFETKLLSFYKDTVTLKEKEISFDDFVKLANKQSGKNKIFESLSNLVKF